MKQNKKMNKGGEKPQIALVLPLNEGVTEEEALSELSRAVGNANNFQELLAYAKGGFSFAGLTVTGPNGRVAQAT